MSESSNQFTAALERLRGEGRTLQTILSNLSEADWRKPTPAAGWTIAHQVAHLTWTDTAALTALRDATAFETYRQGSAENPGGFVDAAADDGAGLSPADIFARWTASRDELAHALAQADQHVRFPWFGPGMKARSMITARIMETWAHGQDISNALGAAWPATDALKDIAHLGLATRKFTYLNNELEPPTSEMYVELTGPQQQVWTWGSPDAENTVRGSAWDFALLVTQRAELSALDLHITGDDAAQWASIAQAFAGAPKSVVRGRQAEGLR